VIRTSPVPLGAIVIFPFEEEIILFPETSNAEVNAL